MDAHTVIERLAGAGLTLALAESCTAGLAAAELGGVPGASRVLWGAFVAYTPEAKESMLGVPRALIDAYGAASGEAALALADGALRVSGASLAAAVTGLAGPGGNGRPPDAAPGTRAGDVWFAVRVRDGRPAGPVFRRFDGPRDAVRHAAVSVLFGLILDAAGLRRA